MKLACSEGRLKVRFSDADTAGSPCALGMSLSYRVGTALSKEKVSRELEIAARLLADGRVDRRLGRTRGDRGARQGILIAPRQAAAAPFLDTPERPSLYPLTRCGRPRSLGRSSSVGQSRGIIILVSGVQI